MVKPSEVHHYDAAEIAFLKGEPFEEIHHSYNCECEACAACESHEYVYIPMPFEGVDTKLLERVVFAAVVVALASFISLVVALVQR